MNNTEQKAFPSSHSEPIIKGKFGQIGVRETYESGMTIRDYFAAKALQSLLRDGHYLSLPVDHVAREAHRIADAMTEAGKL